MSKKLYLKMENNDMLEIFTNCELVLGRKDIDSNPDIDLGPYDNGPYVSRSHGVLYLSADGLFYTDTSTNGTIVNGKKMKKDEKLKISAGDRIKIGEIKLEIVES